MSRWSDTRRILVPVDFSDSARPIVDSAVDMARGLGAEIVLLHVLEQAVPAGSGAGESKALAAERAASQKSLGELAAAADPSKQVKILAKVAAGTPSREIVREAVEGKAELIVIGTHGRTGLRHVFLGSVAEDVVRSAPCPVYTLRLKGFEAGRR